jgi:release factor glutamine methyltransferase
MKLKDLAERFNNSLSDIYGTEETYAIFLIVIKEILGYSRADFLLKKEKNLTVKQLDKLQGIETELKTGKPVQYVIGETEFYGLRFKVSPAVLIPRPETEELVEWVIDNGALADAAGSSLRILDIGTGSGCIAVSVKKKLLSAEVFALDVSENALAVATANAYANQVTINFINADIRSFSTLQKFDIIVSNPPYITIREKEDMHLNVLDHEPHLALFVANERPLEFYESIADFAWLSLSDFGLLFFEISEHLGKETVEMLMAKSFVNIELRKDMHGKDRMIKCEKAIL